MKGSLPSHSRRFVTGSQKCTTAINKEEEIMSKNSHIISMQNQALGIIVDSLNRSVMNVRSQPVQMLMNKSLSHLSNKILEIFVNRASLFHPSFLQFWSRRHMSQRNACTRHWCIRKKLQV